MADVTVVEFTGRIVSADRRGNLAVLTLEIPIEEGKPLVRQHFGDPLRFTATPIDAALKPGGSDAG